MMAIEEMYVSGAYLAKNPTWHVEESPWKARQIMRMLAQHHIAPETICEVGCGAGEVLRQLQQQMDAACVFWGYDVSPQALERAAEKANEKLHFQLLDIRQEQGLFYDLMLVLDVAEHLEDYYSFLRDIRPRSDYKLFHIPLDLSVQTVLRRNGLLKVRESYGHLHYFTKETALQMVKDSGYDVLDCSYTPRAIEVSSHEFTRRLLRLPRRLLFALHKDMAVRILGGWSLLILAR